MSSTEAAISPAGKPSTGFWVGTIVGIIFVGVIGGVGAAILAWRKGYRTAAKWLSIVSVVWTAIIVAVIVLLLTHVPSPSAASVQSWVASQFKVNSVVCNMPGSWSPGTTFTCFGTSGSGNNGSVVKITVLRNFKDGQPDWFGQEQG
jgi:hypothetical protein